MSQQNRPRRSDFGDIPALTTYVGGTAGTAHNEAAFHHLLRIERGRAAKAGHALTLVLISLPGPSRGTTTLTMPASARIFAALGLAVREVDLVGWFREGRVAAAVLVQRSAPTVEIRQQIAIRVRQTLQSHGVHAASAAKVRVLSLSGQH